jgi:peptidoglycan/LPS O-acetylase OafA/YrhL
VLALTFLGGLSNTPLFMSQILSFLALGCLYFLHLEGSTFQGPRNIFAYAAFFLVFVYLVRAYTKSDAATIAGAILIVVPMLLIELRLTDKSSMRLDHRLGDLSYTVFLLHVPIGSLVKNYLGVSVLSFAVGAIASFAASLAVSQWVRSLTGPLRDWVRGHPLVSQ